MFTLQDISKQFGGIQAIQNLSLTVEKRDVLGLIGPNGAGKTTALNVLSGILSPSRGKIFFQDRNITALKPEKRAALGIARTFQNIRLFDELTVLQNVMSGAHARHGASLFQTFLGTKAFKAQEKIIRDLAEDIMDKTSLTRFAYTKAENLSYGDKRRVEIARALACEPVLLMLDEPAAGMNTQEKEQLSELISDLNQQQNLTIILIEHNVPMVSQLCNKLAVLNKGELIAFGVTKETLASDQVIDIYIGRQDTDEAEPEHAEPA